MKKIKYSYNESEITDEILKSITETGDYDYQDFYDQKPSKEQVMKDIYNGRFNFEFEDQFEYFCENIGALFNKKCRSGCCKIEGYNLDWMHRSGYKYFMSSDKENFTKTGREILQAITPEGQYSAKAELEKNKLKITTYHHDCPTGSTFIFSPCSQKTYYAES